MNGHSVLSTRLGAFVSPWPHLESAWLINLPSGMIMAISALVSLFAVLTGSYMRKNSARIVRYGQGYLKTINLKPRRGRAVGSVLLTALAVWAVVNAVTNTPANVPVFVWFASLRDAIVLTVLAVCWWITDESNTALIKRLLRVHNEKTLGESSAPYHGGKIT